MEKNNNTNQTQPQKKVNPARVKYNELVENFISDLEQGAEPWKKSWNLEQGLPQSMVTNGYYSGINLISLLSENKFKSNKWITAKQAEKLNTSIKDTEIDNAKDIFFLKEVKKLVEKKDPQMGKIQEIEETYKVLRSYKVYNIEQTNLLVPEEELKSKNQKILEAEQFIKSLNLNIFRGEPAYSPSDDCLFIPDISEFKDSDNYYHTMLHEISHWSGHPKRLNRKKHISKYDDTYAMEELIAELSASFLSCEKGISLENTQTSSYLDSWVKALKANPYILFSASSHASKATNYLQKLSEKNMKQQQDKSKIKSKRKWNQPKVA